MSGEDSLKHRSIASSRSVLVPFFGTSIDPDDALTYCTRLELNPFWTNVVTLWFTFTWEKGNKKVDSDSIIYQIIWLNLILELVTNPY